METADTPALLLLDLPPSALAGIDLLSFTVTPRFRGVKHLPSGFHFAFCGTSTAFSERHGIWFYITNLSEGKGETPLFIAKWNVVDESLDAETKEAERLKWRANLGSVWREGLIPYRQTTSKSSATAITAQSNGDGDDDGDEEESNDWPTLTSHITPALLSRITGSKDAHQWSLTSASSARGDLEHIPGLSSEDKDSLQSDKELHFIPINLKQTWPLDATGRERTLHAQDRSWALQNFAPDGDLSQYLGELQFTFLTLLTLNNFSSLEQWKRLLTLIFTCKSAVAKNPDFFISAISILRLQLQHCKDAEGGLIDLAEDESLLKSLLLRFRKGLEGMSGAEIVDVIDELDDLEDHLRQEHNWQFGGDFARAGVLELEDGEQVKMQSTVYDEEDELGEFAPQIVDLTQEQARLLGITPEDAKALGATLSKTKLDDDVAGVVQDSGDDGSDDYDDGDEREKKEESDEEEMQDLENMDSRY